MIHEQRFSRLATQVRRSALADRVTGPRPAVRRRPATRKLKRVRSPLHDIVERVERSRKEKVMGALASFGVAFLLLASLLPAACAAIQL